MWTEMLERPKLNLIYAEIRTEYAAGSSPYGILRHTPDASGGASHKGEEEFSRLFPAPLGFGLRVRMDDPDWRRVGWRTFGC